MTSSRSFSLSDLISDSSSEEVVTRLVGRGFDRKAAGDVFGMFQKAAGRLHRNLGGAKEAGDLEATAFWVPGRVEVVGKHTDYAGGRSLLGAVTKGFAIVTTARADGKVGVYTQFADDTEDARELEVTASLEALHAVQKLPTMEGGWAAYPASAIQRLASNFAITKGADISMECNLPEASGMSSSSAVICYMWLVLDHYNGISASSEAYARSIRSVEELYTFLGNIENGKDFKPGHPTECLAGSGGVGTFGGSEDHTAIMSCEKGRLNMFSYCPTHHERAVDVDGDVRFIIAVSGAKAEKTQGSMQDYNDACQLAAWAAAAYTVAKADQIAAGGAGGKGADLDIAAIYGDVPCYNAAVPNLSEVVARECKEDGAAANSPAVRARILALLGDLEAAGGGAGAAGSMGFKAAVKARFEGSPLDVGAGFDSDRITMDVLKVRFEQFFDESEDIVPAVAEAFAARDYDTLGKLCDASHQFTVEKLKNTIPETAWLPRWARNTLLQEEEGKGGDGQAAAGGASAPALAASAFGAGFGGSCWALVEAERADAFCAEWRAAYDTAFPPKEGDLTREFFVMGPAPGAFALGQAE